MGTIIMKDGSPVPRLYRDRGTMLIEQDGLPASLAFAAKNYREALEAVRIAQSKYLEEARRAVAAAGKLSPDAARFVRHHVRSLQPETARQARVRKQADAAIQAARKAFK